MKPYRFASLSMLSLALLAAPTVAETQQAAKVPRIGVVSGAAPDRAHPVRGLSQGLRELGYIDGQNIIVDYRWAHGKPDLIPGLVADLIAARVDVIVAGNTAAAVAAKNASRTIPIVMTIVSEPIKRGLIASYSKPGGNVTGMTPFALEMTAKQLEILKQAFPGATRFAVLWNPGYEPSADHLRRAQAAADSLGLQLQPVGASRVDEFDTAFAAMSGRNIDAALVVADPTFFAHAARLAQLALKHRVPTIYGFREHVDAGGLMAYTSDAVDLFRRAAHYIDRILKGAKPGDLPVEQPTKFDVVINLRTAKALGLTIPPSLLLRADHIIE